MIEKAMMRDDIDEIRKTHSIARICHEANRAYCLLLGDTSQLHWEDAPSWQKESAISGVLFHFANPSASAADSHQEWLNKKTADGWTYGEKKDPEKKQHPCCVPYGDLPVEQRTKDALFKAIVHAVRNPNT